MSIGNGVPYFATGLRLDGSIEEGDVVWQNQTVSTTINANAACLYASGYVSSNTTTFAATFAGVALFGQTITTPTAAIAIIKPNPNKYFWIPVGSATLITQAAVGTLCDFDSSGQKINLTANSPTAYGMQVVDFDASTLAVAANAAGYAKVRIIAASE